MLQAHKFNLEEMALNSYPTQKNKDFHMLKLLSSVLASLLFMGGFSKAAESVDPLIKGADSTETLSPGNLGDTGNMAFPD